MGVTERRVVCAAIRRREDHSIICGPRHHHCFWALDNSSKEDPNAAWEQGFVDQYNWFMGREEALTVAKEAGQILKKTGCLTQLFSEDLY